MPSLLAPRLSCFYCGARSPHVKDGRTRQFTCNNCTATNHLDAKGEITDPPATPSTKQHTSFAHPPPRPISPIQPESDNLFCKTCLQNQQILTNLLAEYLPPEDHPQYLKYENEYPQYRKNLEQRYPQVCPRCAPQVQKHLNRTAYAAKADFLTKNLERSKARPVSNLSTSTSLLISALNLAAMAWWASILFQAYWHALAFLGIPGDLEEVVDLTPFMVVGCSINGLRSRLLPSGCAHLFVDLVKKSLYLSFWLLWWNPTLGDRLRYPYRTHHALGLADFYRFQVIILGIRATAWNYLSGPWTEGSASDINKGMHGCAILFILLSTVASLRVISYSSAPKISWKANTEPLIEPGSFHPATENFTSQASPYLATIASPSREPFPLENLGPRSATHSAARSTAREASPLLSRFGFGQATPSEAAQEAEEDSMDWEPVSQSSPIRPTHTSHPSPLPAIPAFLRPAPSMATGEKSPFTGRLPPAPISPAHRLRNPPAPPQFKPTPLSQQRDFFSRMGLSSANVNSAAKEPLNATPSPTTPKAKTYISSLDKNSSRDTFELKPAQWTLKSDMDAATKGTGLEDIFTSSFNINDDPMTPRSIRRTAAGDVTTTPRGAGDGREIFGHNSGPRIDETAAEIARRNVKEMAVPAALALGACVVAVLREPGVRDWIASVLT